ncbi:MAG: citrate synthase [Clostridia bacterium]|nr:citrate synthase [Clostridia bacterium]
MPVENYMINRSYLDKLYKKFTNYTQIDPSAFDNVNIKRGLRNADGTGVMAGVTLIGNVHGYLINEGDRMPIDGELYYRGINIKDLVEGYDGPKNRRFEEVAHLLLLGSLPNAEEFEMFGSMLTKLRDLPRGFTEDMIIKAPSSDIMNKMGRSVLAMYSYDPDPSNLSVENVLRQCIELTARLPIIAAHAFHVKRHFYDRKSLYIHLPKAKYGTAGNFLNAVRPDKKFTESEESILDLALVLHAEHGGGNNSTFTTRVLTSAGTDTYSAISAAIGSLRGYRHGGANIKVHNMFETMKEDVHDVRDDDEIADYLERILRKEVGDRSGLIYGMGHAIYTKSDPRAVLLKKAARELAIEKGMLDEFELLDRVERLAPAILNRKMGANRVVCANVDMYSGFVYRMLNIPMELYTPLFAIARIAGWSAHRVEELLSGTKIIRPAYKNIAKTRAYTPMSERTDYEDPTMTAKP